MNTAETTETTHEQVSADVARFLARGGKIKKSAPGATALLRRNGMYTKTGQRRQTQTGARSPEFITPGESS